MTGPTLDRATLSAIRQRWHDATERRCVDLAADLHVDAAVLSSALVTHVTDGRTALLGGLVNSDLAELASTLDQLRTGELTLEDTPDGPELVHHTPVSVA